MKNKKILSIFYFVLALIFIVVGVLMIPTITDLGNMILLYVLAAMILAYVFTYLLKLVKNYTGTRQIFIVIEMVLDLVLVASLVFSEVINFITIKESFKVIGSVVWLHAAFAMMGGYYTSKTNNNHYPFYALLIDIFLLTLGTFLFVKPLLTNYEMIIVTSVLSFTVAVVCILFGFVTLKKRK